MHGCEARAHLMDLRSKGGRAGGKRRGAADREVLGARVTEGCSGHDKDFGVLL